MSAVRAKDLTSSAVPTRFIACEKSFTIPMSGLSKVLIRIGIDKTERFWGKKIIFYEVPPLLQMISVFQYTCLNLSSHFIVGKP